MNRYTILGQSGDGSFGTVMKAQNTETGEVVAVKKMKQRFQTWEECLQLREIQSLRKLQHPNIVKLKEVVRENTELFMVFEFCEKNIFQMQRERMERITGTQPFSEREIRSILCQTLLGVQSIHKAGFMHRDLKPENLLVKGDWIKVADFGLAKEIRSRPPFTEYVSTRWYRAPEIVLHSTHYNSPMDVWALGAIFAELFLGRPLFPGTSESDQLFKICSVLGAPQPGQWDEGYQLARRLNLRIPSLAPTPLKKLLPSAPATAIDLMEKMLRFNPGERLTVSQCLQHPFFTDNESSSTLFAGVSTGQPHNPFQMAKDGTLGGASNNASPNNASPVGFLGNSVSFGPSTGRLSPPSTAKQKYAGLFNPGNRSPLSTSLVGNQPAGSSDIVRSVPQRRQSTSTTQVATEANTEDDDEFNF